MILSCTLVVLCLVLLTIMGLYVAYSLPFLYMQAHEDVYEVVVCLFITKIGLTNPYYGTMNLWVS